MYNSTNLPLDRKKIIKKTLEKGFLPTLGFIAGIVIVLIGLISEYGIIFYILGPLVFLLSIIGTYLYQVYYYKLYFYNFGETSAEIRKGVISRSTGHVQYSRIQNVYIDQDVLDRIFGLYDVHYETAGEVSGIYSHVDGLNKENSEKLTDFLNSKLRLGNNINPHHSETIAADVQSSHTSTVAPAANGEVISTIDTPLSKKYLLTTLFSKKLLVGLGYLIASTIYGASQEETEIENFIAFLPYVAIALLFIIVCYFIYNWIWFRNFYFEFNNNSGVVKTRVIAQTQTFIYYDRVQNINIHQGLVERLLGIGDIIIETAAGNGAGSQLVIPGLSYSEAEKLKDFLLEKVKLYRSNSRLGL